MRLLQLVTPVSKLLPELYRIPPGRQVPAQQRLINTVFVLLLLLVLRHAPLYGLTREARTDEDPLALWRIPVGSNHGKFLELGILPLLTAGLLLQTLIGSKTIRLNLGVPRERALVNATQKLLAVVLTIVYASLLVFSGAFGNELNPIRIVFIIVQLAATTLLLSLMDELLHRGYGFGNAVYLCIAASVGESIVTDAFETIIMNRGVGNALFDARISGIIRLLVTIVVLAIAVYFQACRIDLPIKTRNYRGAAGVYPLKLFYTAGIPLAAQIAVMSNVYLLAYIVGNLFSNMPLISLLGNWNKMTINDEGDAIGPRVPTSGLAYYFAPPQSLLQFFTDPFSVLFFVTFSVSLGAIFSSVWIYYSGSSASDLADAMLRQDIKMGGGREDKLSMTRTLNRYIPTAASFGAVAGLVLAAFGDLFGAMGTGTGAVFAITIIYQYYEELAKLQMEQMGGPMM